VAPRTAQAAMRHSSPRLRSGQALDLTMNVYTDPTLLDVAGAMEVLPELTSRLCPGQTNSTALACYSGAFSPGGSAVAHAGRYTYWFHNNSAMGHNFGRYAVSRNPAWLLGGEERDAPGGEVTHWGLPEVVLYDDDPQTGISYPDFTEDDGRLFISEAQKSIARVHEVPGWLLDRLWTNRAP